MPISVKSQIDFNKIETKNLVLENRLSTDTPIALPHTGQMYFETDTGKLKIYNVNTTDWEETSGEIIVDVASLPTIDIKTNVIYRLAKEGYIYNNNFITQDTVTCYSVDGTVITISATGLTDNTDANNPVEYIWEDLTDAIITSFGANITETDFSKDVNHFCKYGTNLYDSANNFIFETDYKLYFNPTGNNSNWFSILNIKNTDFDSNDKLVFEKKTQTIENKTIDVDDNILLNVETDNFKLSALATSTDNVRNYNNSVDTKLITEKFLQKTLQNIETPTNDSNAVNKKYVDDEIAEIKGEVMTFKGFISTIEPTGTIQNGRYWYNSNVFPTTFPINVKVYNAITQIWSTETIEYIPTDLDLWSNLNNENGYYWFGNKWNILDDNVLVDDITIEKNLNGELQIKDSGITFIKLNSSLIATIISNSNNTIPRTDSVYKELLNNTNSNFTKSYSNNNLDLTINLKDNNNTSKIDKTTTLLTKLSDYTNLTDTDKLSFLNITTQELKDVALSAVNSYIQNKISVGDGLTKDANNVIKHSNSITAKTQKIIPSLTYDAQGHITSADTITFENSIGISANKIGIRNPITADATNGLKTFSVNDVGLITGYTAKSLGRGINDNNNVIGHSNNITAQTTQKIGVCSFDAQGHITGFSERPILTAVDENSTDQQLISAKCFYDNSLLFEIHNIADVLDLVNSKFSISNTTKYNACCILKKDKSMGRLLLNFYTDSSTKQTSAGWKRISLLNSNFPYKVYNPNNLSSTAEVARNLGSMWDGSGYSNLALSVYANGDIQTYYYNAILNKTGGMNIALDIPITKK